jgi:hypothetical protein
MQVLWIRCLWHNTNDGVWRPQPFFLGGLVQNIVMLNHCQTRYPIHTRIQEYPAEAEPILIMLMYSPTLQAGGVQVVGLSSVTTPFWVTIFAGFPPGQVAAPPLAAVAGLVQVRTLVCFPELVAPPQGPMQLLGSDHRHLMSMFTTCFVCHKWPRNIS